MTKEGSIEFSISWRKRLARIRTLEWLAGRAEALGRPSTVERKPRAGAGLPVERGGIRVDDQMRTSDPHIWAMVDAIEVKEIIYRAMDHDSARLSSLSSVPAGPRFARYENATIWGDCA
jgi:hypothetical protein